MKKTKCLKDPSHYIFSESREFKDIRYDDYNDKDNDQDKDKDKSAEQSKQMLYLLKAGGTRISNTPSTTTTTIINWVLTPPPVLGIFIRQPPFVYLPNNSKRSNEFGAHWRKYSSPNIYFMSNINEQSIGRWGYTLKIQKEMQCWDFDWAKCCQYIELPDIGKNIKASDLGLQMCMTVARSCPARPWRKYEIAMREILMIESKQIRTDQSGISAEKQRQ